MFSVALILSSASSSLLLDTSCIFFSSAIIFLTSVTSLMQMVYLFIEILTVFILSSPELDEHIYDNYFEFTNIFGILSFFFTLKHIPLCLHFV